MSSNQVSTAELLRPLELDGGGFAMLALDQRESLRRMFPLVHGREVDDETLRSFKEAAIATLSPLASAVLLDRPYAVTHRRPPELASDTALILAADVLEQPAGEPVLTTSLDPLVTAEFVASVGAAALKFLVIWRNDGQEAQREALVGSFLEVAEEADVASLVEGIVRPVVGDDWANHAERHEAILRAAAELSSYGGTIYKAEVPGYIPGDLSLVHEQAERLSELVAGPWVVLSNGVAQADFAEAVRESVRGGASGFLAGRAIWADTVGESDPVRALEERSTERLRALTLIVAEGLQS